MFGTAVMQAGNTDEIGLCIGKTGSISPIELQHNIV